MSTFRRALELARGDQRLPVVLSQQEVQSVLSHLHGTPWLMASILYGGGVRLMECVQLRVKDLDFHYKQIIVRNGKGSKDRRTMIWDCTVRTVLRVGQKRWLLTTNFCAEQDCTHFDSSA